METPIANKQQKDQSLTSPTLAQLKELNGFLASASKSHHHERDSKNNPLTGRKVFIPITTKGFFEGTLTPFIRKTESLDSSSSVASVSNIGKEQVMTKIGQNYMAEMTTDEACKYIERRMEAIRSLAKGTPEVKDSLKEPTKAKNGKKNKLKLKKGFLQPQSPKKTSSEPAPALSVLSTEQQPSSSARKQFSNEAQGKTVVAPSLPFMEIREEYDLEGNEIKAEALDVSKELLNLHRTINSKKKENVGRNRPSEANILETLAESVPKFFDSNENENDDDTGERSISNDVHDNQIPDMVVESNVQANARPYEEITTRLDELILLEEEDEKKKAENTKSSKALQGSGWKKGFLSNPGGKKKKKVPLPRKIASVSLSNSNRNSKSQCSKSVQFGENEVKEIPRIGTKSIQSVMTPRQMSQTHPQSMNDHDIGSNVMEETSISLGQTQLGNSLERRETRRPAKAVSLGGIVEHPGASIAGSDSISNSSDNQPKKKMSRFAQRRHHQR